MARLPKPGGDEEVWAKLLNEYLLVAHNADGTPRKTTLEALAATVGLSDLRTKNAASEPLKGLLLSNDGTDLIWKKPPLDVSVTDFGAVGDGVTDDTDAVQAAIDTAKDGGAIVFPRGVYMVRGLKLKAHGTQLMGGARWGTRIVRLSGTAPLVDMSGTGTLNKHLKYCSLFNVMLSGNGLPGMLVRSYYSDNHIFLNTSFIHCKGLSVDFVEAWDARFDNCSWEDCGSVEEPAVLFRNSTRAGTFGYGTDSTNQIHFVGCRWEGWRNGALKLDGGANDSPSLLNGVFFTACKMETRYAAGPALQIMAGSTIVFVNQLYIAIMAADAGYTHAIDAVEDRGTHVFMTDLYVQWGAAVGLANALIHIWRGSPHMYHEVSAFFPTEDPAAGIIVTEPEADAVMVSCLWTNRGRLFIGDVNNMLEGGPEMGYTMPINNVGALRVTSSLTGKDLIKADNNPVRPALQAVNATDVVGFSDAYITEKWRVVGATGAARFAAGKFQIEGTKGYVGINATPFTGIAMLIRAAAEGDRGIAVVRPSSAATNRLMEFQDETYNIQGLAIDSNGRPIGVGTPPRVAAGDQASYANPGIQVRDIAGNISVAIKPSPTAPGTIATVTFSRAYANTPLNIAINDHSGVSGDLYVSARSAKGFTISTRSALRGGSLLNFDYSVIG